MRPNAMPRGMMAELGALWDQLEASSCRCIILTGAGERAHPHFQEGVAAFREKRQPHYA